MTDLDPGLINNKVLQFDTRNLGICIRSCASVYRFRPIIVFLRYCFDHFKAFDNMFLLFYIEHLLVAYASLA